MRSVHIGVMLKAPKQTLQNDRLTFSIKEEELCSKLFSDDGMFRALIFNVCWDGEWDESVAQESTLFSCLRQTLLCDYFTVNRCSAL